MNIRQEVTLYLNGQQVDLNDNGGIFFNYKQKDVKNPTVVKNSFSKTLTIPGTDNNDVIFNNIWDLTRVQTTDVVPYFNQSKRVPFELFLNGELIEQGYCKLDRIRRDKVNEYDLSLYGGLGDFFYSLAYNAETGNKRTLADLDWDISGFTINKETVKENWDELASGETPTIAFAPMYNGVNDKMDASKVLINTDYDGDVRIKQDNGSWVDMTGFPTSISGYTTYGGFALATLEEPTTEWRTRDLRSWIQRPALSVKSLFTAISNPDSNGGYELSLDNEFFNNQNPYYSQAYITLPQISQLNINKETESGTMQISLDEYYGSSQLPGYITYDFEENAGNKYTVTFLPTFYSESRVPNLYTSAYGVVLPFVPYSFGGIAIQLLGLDDNDNEVGIGDVAWLTSRFGSENQFITFDQATSQVNPFQAIGNVNTYTGQFSHSGNGVYTWSQGVTISLSSFVKIKQLKLKIIYLQGGATTIPTQFKGLLWPSTEMQETQEPGAVIYVRTPALISASYKYTEQAAAYSNMEVSLDDLLNTQNTPADYLLSYCKLFNLYFDQDVSKKKVSILTSKNFYDKDVDLTDDMDREIEIEPLSFEHKWYSFKYKENKTETLDNYKAKYGTDFGQQRVNTGYEFDSETEELLKDNIFVNASQVLEVNKDYIKRTSNQVDSPAFLTDNVTYSLFNGNMDKTDIEMGKPTNSWQTVINPKSQGVIKYDSFSKVQVHNQGKPADGSNILIFFNGMKETNVDYWISDDLSYMMELAGKPCWLYTTEETTPGGTDIAIKTRELPQFSRYIDDDEYIYASWDFGRTKELFVPGLNYIDGNATLYERYWRNYIQDLYDIDTRIVTAHIQFDEKPTKESLKHFYYFEGSYWVIDEIIDYNPTSYELTKVKFVKVNDKNNYLNNNVVPPSPGPEPPVVKQFEFRPEGIMVNANSGSTSTTLLVSGYEVVEWTIPTQSWYTITRNGNTVSITYTANPDTTDRSFSIGVAGRDGSEIVTTIYNFTQKGVVIPDTVSITAPSPIAATATTLTYSVTATKPVTVKILPQDTTNTHGTGTSLGSFSIPANTAATAEYYSLLAWLTDYPSITAATSVIQDGVSVYVTGITLSSTWATDVPYTGGTATYQNCNNVVTAYYSDGTSADITSQASFTASTSLNVPSTTSTTRDSVGVISVIASYYDGPNPFTSTVVVTAYQEAAGTPPTPTVTWQAYNRSEEWNVYGNLHTGSTQDYAGLELHTGETEDHNEAVPVTLTSAYLALTPAPQNPENYSIVLSNSTYGDAMTCTFDSVGTANNAWVGTGSVRLEQGTILDVAVVQINSRGRAQVEPEPDETENEEEDSN